MEAVKSKIIELMLENGLDKAKGPVLTVGSEYGKNLISDIIGMPSINLSENKGLALPTLSSASNYIFVKGKIRKNGLIGIKSIGKQRGEVFPESLLNSPIFNIGRAIVPLSIDIRKVLLLPNEKLEKFIKLSSQLSAEQFRELLTECQLVRVSDIADSVVTIDPLSDDKIESLCKSSKYKCPIYIGHIPQRVKYIKPEEELCEERAEYLRETLNIDDVQYFELSDGAKVIKIGSRYPKNSIKK